jgi:hypothetical protein
LDVETCYLQAFIPGSVTPVLYMLDAAAGRMTRYGTWTRCNALVACEAPSFRHLPHVALKFSSNAH